MIGVQFGTVRQHLLRLLLVDGGAMSDLTCRWSSYASFDVIVIVLRLTQGWDRLAGDVMDDVHQNFTLISWEKLQIEPGMNEYNYTMIRS